MVNQVQSINTQNNVSTALPFNYSRKIEFKAPEYGVDSFRKKEKNQFTKLNACLALTTVVCFSAFAYAHGSFKNAKGALEHAKGYLGNFIKNLGEEVPGGIEERIVRLFDFASKDSMTGLLNKKSLMADISKYYSEAIEKGHSLSAAFLDMDNFKGINEVFDHKKGDEVLKRIAANVQKVAEKHGLKSFRYGGEEFVVTAPGHDAEKLHVIVEEVAESIKKDKAIQGLLPEFIQKANAEIKSLSAIRKNLDSIFSRLKAKRSNKDNEKLAQEIISLVEDYTSKDKSSKNKPLLAVLKKLKTTPSGKLDNVLKIHTKIFDGLTLGNELDKIYTNSSDMQHDLQKWVNHLNKHGLFTVSGGVADLRSSASIDSGDALIKAADAALKSAKENGKNKIQLAHT